MKILYIASERSRAQVATRALRTLAPGVTVLWGSSYERAAFAILENPDLSALIVEVQSDTQGCFYLKQMHSLGVQAPVVMVLPEGAGSPIESLKAGADAYVVKSPSFSEELPAVVTRAIRGEQAPRVPGRDSGPSAPAEPAVGVPVERRANRGFIPPIEPPRRVSDVEASLQQRAQRSVTEPSAAAGHQAKLEILLRQERDIRTGLEQKLAEAIAALRDAEQRHLSATTSAATQATEHKTQYEASMARAASTQKTLEEQLRHSRQSRAIAVADVERLTLRNAELSSRLTEATASGNTLERRLAEIQKALDAANARASHVQEGAAEQAADHQAELQSQLEQEVQKRRHLEEELARAKTALEDADKQRSSVMTAATALWTERQAQFDAELTTAAEARNTLGRQARELETSLDQARQTIQAHAATVDRLMRRETELTSQLAEAVAMQSTLERQLTEAADALKDAREGASRGRLTAATERAERQVQFESELSQTAATRDDFKRRFSEAETALASARHDHAAAANEVERLTRRETELTSKLAQVEAAFRDADEQRAAAMAAAGTHLERLTQREADLTSQLTEAAAMRSILERQLTDAADAFKAADEGAARDRLAADTRAAERETEVNRLLRDERVARADVEQRLGQVEAALREAERQHTAAMTAAATERAERQEQFERELSQTAATRDAFKRRFSEAETALAAARHDRTAAANEIERLTRCETEVTSKLAHVEAAFRDAEQQRASAMAAAATHIERLTQHESELTSQLAEAAEIRNTLERRLTTAADALKAAEEAAKQDRLTAEIREKDREVEFDGLIHHERAARANVEQRLAKADAALRDAEQHHASAMTAAATERAERQAQFESELSQTAATRDEFKRRFSDAEIALASARRDHAAAANEVERLTRRETELTSKLAHVEATLREAEQQHASAMAVAATERADLQAQFESELSQTAATRDEFERRFSEAETALAESRHDHLAAVNEVERLTRRETELTSKLAEAAEVRSNLEGQLTDAAIALKAADEGAKRDRLAAETRAAEREAEFGALIGHERAARADIEQRLAHVEATLHEAEQQHASAMAIAATDRAERQAQFERELSQTANTRDEFKRRFSEAETALASARHDHAAAASEVNRLTRRETELTSQLAEAADVRSTLERQLTDTASALKDAEDSAARDRLAAEARAVALDNTIDEMRSAAADAEQRFREEIATVTARGRHQVTQLEGDFAKEREAHKERQARLLNEIQNLEAARGALDESLASIREQSQLREIAHQNERDGLERGRLAAETDLRRLAAELTEARQNFQQTLDLVSSEHADSQAKLVATVADRDARIEEVEKHLEESRLELRRQFLRAPLALWRCTRDGALTHANKALADLVGYRQPDELRGGDFVNAVFESTDDLSWLIERCLSTKKRESVETAWKQKNGERLAVRLSAVEFAPDVIEIAVEDVTNVHVLEDRLARAHRMEAVARLASEIAVTCGRLLGDVNDDGQQWLMELSDDTALRRRGERLLGEVARAASYLERLAAHGDEQTSALKPVELNRVLRDLKPVLKHVAGDDVDLELSKMSSVLNVDMKADRLERLFVNLASYGRERMPGGGRLRIELDTVVVDQKFIADHPNVRRGHHALITVTTVRRALPTAAQQLQAGAPELTASEAAPENPGVDLGALQELLQECGGHLWLTVDPPGNMVVKIRLPLRVWDDRPHPTTSDSPTGHNRVVADTPSSRKRVMPRWFRH